MPPVKGWVEMSASATPMLVYLGNVCLWSEHQ